MSVSQDDEVIFLGQDGNILVDPFCDTLIYPPLQASNDEQASNINDPLNSITAAIYTNNEIIDLHINSQSVRASLKSRRIVKKPNQRIRIF